MKREPIALPRQTRTIAEGHRELDCTHKEDGRRGKAAYNFVPLPELVVRAADSPADLPDHDTYATPDHPHTGYFDVTLTTRSPLYIRCPLTLEQFLRQERGEDAAGGAERFRDLVKNTPDFFYTAAPTEPVVPGSSLRGMLRTLVEIAGYGKVARLSDKRLFFRTVDDTVVGRAYNARMRDRVEAGFLRREGNRVYICKCHMARVPRGMLDTAWHVGREPGYYDGKAPNLRPKWSGPCHQHQPVWVALSANRRFVERLETAPAAGLVEGRLVLTGEIKGKKHEFVFLLPGDGAERIPVPDELLARFRDEDQISRWQEEAFPRDRPAPGARNRAGGLLRDLSGVGDPVFFLMEPTADDGGGDDWALTFFGRAGMFRLPYKRRAIDLVPPELRRPEDIDFADALFGFVRTSAELKDMERRGLPMPKQGEKGRAYAGRVSVTDARLVPGQQDLWLAPEPIVPRILSSPKPTSIQHYLVQQDDRKDCLAHYDSPTPSQTVIRGHKIYWHQGPRDAGTIAPHNPPTGTQYTLMRPLRAGVSFTFRVCFEQLSDVELGALAWTIQPPAQGDADCCHSLGMGKPLGMGAVKLASTLHLVDRRRRYRRFFAGEALCQGDEARGDEAAIDVLDLGDAATLAGLTRPFETEVLRQMGVPTDRQFHQLKRIAALLRLMEWPGIEDEADRGYGEWKPCGQTAFRTRRVLPDPVAVREPERLTNPPARRPDCRPPAPPADEVRPARPGAREPAEVRAIGTEDLLDADAAAAAPAETARGPVDASGIEGTVSTKPHNGRATIRLADGTEVECDELPFWAAEGDRCLVRVTRDGDRIVAAKIVGWL